MLLHATQQGPEIIKKKNLMTDARRQLLPVLCVVCIFFLQPAQVEVEFNSETEGNDENQFQAPVGNADL